MATLFLLLIIGHAAIATAQQPQWGGRVTSEVRGMGADLVWPYFADFCNLYKVFPISVSYCIGGVPGRVGLIRHTTNTIAVPFDVNRTYVRWEKHNLTAIDPVKRSLTYEIVGTNQGTTGWRATFTILPSKYGCNIIWDYVLDPLNGFTSAHLHGLVAAFLDRVVYKVENLAINIE